MKRFILTAALVITAALAFPQTIDDVLSDRYFKTGLMRFYNRQYDAAVQLFIKSLSLQSMNYRARYYLGHAYLNSGYTKQAVDEWENLIRLGGGNYQVRQKLNDLYFRLSIDRTYSYSNAYVLSKVYNGVTEGMHKVIRPSFIIYDEKTDSTFVSAAQTRFVVEIDGNGKVQQQIGRTFGDESEFKMPTGICLYNDILYVADYTKDTIYSYKRDGKLVAKFGKTGYGPSNIAGPMGLYVSPDEYIFVADNGNDRVQKFDLSGNWIQTIGEGEMNRPTDIAGKGQTIYVSDTMNGRVVAYDTFGNMVKVIGSGQLGEPRGLCIKGDLLYIVDAKKGLFIYDLAGGTLEKFGIDEGQCSLPFDVCADSKDILYETDFNSENIPIYIPLELQYGNLGMQVSQIWLSQYPGNYIHLRVWDKKGNPVYNLKEDNFQVYEQGTEIPLVRMGATYNFRNSMYIKFLVDKSAGMREFEPELNDALKAFLSKMTNDRKNDAWLDMITVSDATENSGRRSGAYLWPLEYVKNNEYKNPFPSGFDRAAYQAVTELLNVNRNKAIVMIVSGEGGDESFKDYEPEVIATYARQNAVPIHVIAFSDKNAEIYRKLASDTFGKYYTIRQTREILGLYDEIRNAPPLEYILSYEGLNLRGLRNYWVNVNIRVKYKGMAAVDDTAYYVPESSFSIFDQGTIKEEELIRNLNKKEQ